MAVVEISLEAAFGADLTEPAGPNAWTWTEIGARAGRIRWQGPRRSGPLQPISAGVLTVELDNSDGYLDPRSTTAPSPYVSGGVSQVRPRLPVRLKARYPSGSGDYTGLGVGYRSRGELVQERPSMSTAVWTCPDGLARLTIDRPASAEYGDMEISGERVGRLLDNLPWPSGGEDPGVTPLQATTLAGSALEELQQIALTEFADFYIEGGGYVAFRERANRLIPGAAVAAFSEASSTLDPTDVTIVDDDTWLLNSVVAQRAGGEEQTTTDSASVIKFGKVTASVTGLWHTDDYWTKAWTEGVTLLYADWAPMVESITLDPTTNANLWPVILAPLVIGDYITVLVDGYTRHCFVEGVDHDIYQAGDSMTAWTTTVWTSDRGTVQGFAKWDVAGEWDTEKWAW